MTEPWLSADVIAGHIGVATDNIYARIAKQDLAAHPVVRLWKFKTTEVDSWFRGDGAAEATDLGARQ